MILCAFSLFSCTSHADPRHNVNQELEMPSYEVLKAKGQFEIRVYKPYVIAKVDVSGNFDEASSRGFRKLAKYIFGGNESNTSISMTAPVSVKAKLTPQKTEEIRYLKTFNSGSQRWQVTFSMPSKYTLKTLPIPADQHIVLSQTSSEVRAVIVFSGRVTKKSIERHERLLRNWLKEEGVSAEGEPSIARYNDPFTFPWNRRNEIMVKVELPH